MNINKKDNRLYEDLLIIIQAYEEEVALKEGASSVKIMAMKPISGMRRALTISDTCLADKDKQKNGDSELINLQFGSELQKLTGTKNLTEYLETCLKCDLRIGKLDLQPINLLKPILDLIKEINAALNLLENMLKPEFMFGDICDLLNGLRWLCLPDLIALLVALKFLLGKKRLDLLKISLDWTAILGPLLSAVLAMLNALLDYALEILLMPLECAYSAIKTVADLEKQLAETIVTASRVGDVDLQLTMDNNYRQVNNTFASDDPFRDVVKATTDENGNLVASVEEKDNLAFGIPKLMTKNVEEPVKDEFEFYTGTDIKLTNISKAIRTPSFGYSHWTIKMLVPLAEAMQALKDIKYKLQVSLGSLQGLVSGGMALQIENIAGIMYILKIIQIVLILIEISKELRNGDISFCESLKRNPEKYNTFLNDFFDGAEITVDNLDEIAIVYKGETIGKSQTCIKSSAQINSWLVELTKNGAV